MRNRGNDHKLEALLHNLLPSARTIIAGLIVVSLGAVITAGYGLAGKAKAEQHLRDSERHVEELEHEIAIFTHADGTLGAPTMDLQGRPEVSAQKK